MDAVPEGGWPDSIDEFRRKARGWAMTMVRIREVAVEAVVVAFSAGFLSWYIAAKIAAWPWGAWSY